MIDLRNEEVISLAEAVKRLPARRAGKRTHVATLYRWAKRGVCGVTLETIQVGGTLCTSLEALQRFCDQLSHPSTPTRTRPANSREWAIQRAETELDQLGI